jgi:hypothetical protein
MHESCFMFNITNMISVRNVVVTCAKFNLVMFSAGLAKKCLWSRILFEKLTVVYLVNIPRLLCIKYIREDDCLLGCCPVWSGKVYRRFRCTFFSQGDDLIMEAASTSVTWVDSITRHTTLHETVVFMLAAVNKEDTLLYCPLSAPHMHPVRHLHTVYLQT